MKRVLVLLAAGTIVSAACAFAVGARQPAPVSTVPVQ